MMKQMMIHDLSLASTELCTDVINLSEPLRITISLNEIWYQGSMICIVSRIFALTNAGPQGNASSVTI